MAESGCSWWHVTCCQWGCTVKEGDALSPCSDTCVDCAGVVGACGPDACCEGLVRCSCEPIDPMTGLPPDIDAWQASLAATPDGGGLCAPSLISAVALSDADAAAAGLDSCGFQYWCWHCAGDPDPKGCSQCICDTATNVWSQASGQCIGYPIPAAMGDGPIVCPPPLGPPCGGGSSSQSMTSSHSASVSVSSHSSGQRPPALIICERGIGEPPAILMDAETKALLWQHDCPESQGGFPVATGNCGLCKPGTFPASIDVSVPEAKYGSGPSTGPCAGVCSTGIPGESGANEGDVCWPGGTIRCYPNVYVYDNGVFYPSPIPWSCGYYGVGASFEPPCWYCTEFGAFGDCISGAYGWPTGVAPLNIVAAASLGWGSFSGQRDCSGFAPGFGEPTCDCPCTPPGYPATPCATNGRWLNASVGVVQADPDELIGWYNQGNAISGAFSGIPHGLGTIEMDGMATKCGSPLAYMQYSGPPIPCWESDLAAIAAAFGTSAAGEAAFQKWFDEHCCDDCEAVYSAVSGDVHSFFGGTLAFYESIPVFPWPDCSDGVSCCCFDGFSASISL